MINPLPGMPLIESPLLGAMKPSLAMLHHLLVDHAAGRVGEADGVAADVAVRVGFAGRGQGGVRALDQEVRVGAHRCAVARRPRRRAGTIALPRPRHACARSQLRTGRLGSDRTQQSNRCCSDRSYFRCARESAR